MLAPVVQELRTLLEMVRGNSSTWTDLAYCEHVDERGGRRDDHELRRARMIRALQHFRGPVADMALYIARSDAERRRIA